MRTNVIKKWLSPSPFRTHISWYSTHVHHREVISAKNPAVNAFVHVSELSPSTANNLPLSGLSVAVKDNIATSRLPTTCSSAMLQNFTSPFDATVVKLLEQNGADIIGKTNCDEFGMGSLNIHSVHGPVKNPIGLSQAPAEERSAGGSSGGSAAAVAAGMCHAALGTDTGGSVRLPASYCGIVGLKPSYGLISRWGVVSYADSLDCVGILASDVDTTRRIFEHVTSYDSRDPTSALQEIRDKARRHTEEFFPFSQPPDRIINGLRIGIPQEYFPSEMSPAIIEHLRTLIALLKTQGATIVPVSLPSTSYALSSYYVLASAEASSNLARYDGVQYGSYVPPDPDTDLTKTSKVYARTRSLNFGEEVQKRILLGTYALSADAFDNYFLQARRVRQLVKNDFNRVFSMPNYFSDSINYVDENTSDDHPPVDVLLHPSAIRTAPLLTESPSASEGDTSLSSYVQDVLTVPASLGGLPALSIPMKVPQKDNDGKVQWPVGASIVGQWGTDDLILSVARAIETLQTQCQ
ncbi:amidase signature domain-containing protein [Gymnopilus junonius]|uniref:Glutamyl-tRNA(Gln) amidotransferase subunit A, mitochondrial n=1 Tax=Gymnopilus junonius TaxID=109634 RepID=A0A9P5NRS3_GYMJU|nr:amidase signature domain-containing protein [Gymnopilus junonius]